MTTKPHIHAHTNAIIYTHIEWKISHRLYTVHDWKMTVGNRSQKRGGEGVKAHEKGGAELINRVVNECKTLHYHKYIKCEELYEHFVSSFGVNNIVCIFRSLISLTRLTHTHSMINIPFAYFMISTHFRKIHALPDYTAVGSLIEIYNTAEITFLI